MSNKNTFKYKSDHSIEERKNESSRILSTYPNRLPIICEKAPNSDIPSIQKTKYLVPSDMTVSQLLFLIRRNINLNEISALYLITNGISLSGSKTMGEVYNNLRDKTDNFLYVFCASEITMG